MATLFADQWMKQEGQNTAHSGDYAANREGQNINLQRTGTYLTIASYDQTSQRLTLEEPPTPEDQELLSNVQQALFTNQHQQANTTTQPSKPQIEYG